jgi:uncharacterized membrane protein
MLNPFDRYTIIAFLIAVALVAVAMLSTGLPWRARRPPG